LLCKLQAALLAASTEESPGLPNMQSRLGMPVCAAMSKGWVTAFVSRLTSSDR
jgi:hypothetical protein